MTLFAFRRRSRFSNLWTAEEICTLRRLAQQGLPPAHIATVLERSASSIRNKAGFHGISLRSVPSATGPDDEA